MLPLALLAYIGCPSFADTLQFDFHGKDTSASSLGDLDATIQFTGQKQGTSIKVDTVEIVVIDGSSTATNLFGALGMYQLKPGSKNMLLPVSGVTSQATTFTIINGRDTNQTGNVLKLDIDGKNATLRTRGESMDVNFKGTFAPKSDEPAAEGVKTMYIVGGIIAFAALGTGIYLLESNRQRKERRRKRRRSLLVNETDTTTTDS